MRQNEQMDINETHEWIYDHWKQLVLIAAIVLTGFWVFEMYQSHQQKINAQANSMYFTLLDISPKDTQKQKDVATQIIETYPNTPYYHLSHLKLAALASNEKDYTKTRSHLNEVLKTKDKQLQNYTWSQLAHLEFEQKAYQASIDALSHITSTKIKTMQSDLLSLNYIQLKEYQKADTTIKTALLQMPLLLDIPAEYTVLLKQKLIAIQNDIKNNLSS